MTPSECFEQLIILYPKKWDDAGKIAWADIYKKSLHGIDGNVLEKAFYASVAAQTMNTVPTPANIRSHIAVPTQAPKEFEDTNPYPHSGYANRFFETDPTAQTAIKFGYHLNLWTFLAKQGHSASLAEIAEMEVTNKLFHDSHVACVNKTKISSDRYYGKVREQIDSAGLTEISVNPQMLPIFEQMINKGNKIEAKYMKT